MTANRRLLLLLALLLPAVPALAEREKPGDKTHGEEREIEERERWFRKTRDLDVEDVAVARQRRARAIDETKARLGKGPSVLASQWISVGPSPMTMLGWAMGNVAGRVNNIAVDPTDPNIIYVAAGGGGVWRTTNGGSAWSAMIDLLGTENVGAVAIAPTDHNTIWIGTGDYNGYSGLGVFQSTDAGSTWQARNGSGTMTATAISSLVLHPTNPAIVIVSAVAGGGIFRTTDTGTSWTQTLNLATDEVVRDPSNPNVLYAAVDVGKCYKSTDGGATWVDSSSGIGTGSNRCEVSVAPSSPQTLYLVNDSSELYRSTDGAATWTLRNGNACEGQCWYNMTIEVSLADPNTLYVGTIRPAKSTDGGTTLAYLTSPWGGGQSVHQDTHLIRRHPTDPNTVYVGSDGGLWKTTNAGTSFTNLNGNMNLTMFYDVAVHPTLDTILLGGSQDNSSEAYSGSVVWDVVEVTGDGFVNAINPANTNYCYIASYPSGGPNVARSTTGPNGNYSYITNSISDSASWVTPYMLDPVTPNTIYLGTTRIWRSTNQGTSWTAISANLGGGTMVSLAVGQNTDSIIYAGSGSSSIFQSTDTGASWTNVRGNIPAGHTINDIAVDPADAMHVYAALSGTSAPELWYSTTGGTTWTAATNGIPSVTANSVLVVANPYRIFLGNDIGIFRSDTGDAGPYVADMSGLPLGVPVTDLEFNATTGTITAGTYGRGAWQTPGTCTAPIADFAGNPTSGTAPLTVNFTDQSSGGPTSWLWDFGDGGTSTVQNPSHTYVANGSYTVSLTATNSCGSDTNTKVNYITVTSCPAPVADFSGSPTTGPAPLSVAFADLSTNAPTSWSWDFGDGGTATQQNPGHTYLSPGTYSVSLTVANGCGSDTASKPGYIVVTAPPGITEEIVSGAGAASSNAPVVKTWDHASPPSVSTSFTAYAGAGYGVNVGSVDMVGGGTFEVVTGPGPGPTYGPQVKGFQPSGTAIAKVNFYAYGTLKYGVHVGGGDLDGDAHEELLTAPGPGPVFGPHVRGWNYDGAALTAISKISFFAYATLKYGARVAGGDVDADGFSEILTGAGAGPVFAPHVRGFNYDNGGIGALPISVFAFGSGAFGADVAAGNTDADASDEILASHGPDPSSTGDVKGYDFTGTGVLVAFSFNAFPALGGAEIGACDLDADGKDEVLAGEGWGGATPSTISAFGISGGNATLLESFTAYAAQTYGTKVAGGDTGI
ncbi:MAG: PKD domain-containing protein [Acidobacteriota bacterium]